MPPRDYDIYSSRCRTFSERIVESANKQKFARSLVKTQETDSLFGPLLVPKTRCHSMCESPRLSVRETLRSNRLLSFT
jgi:hypothetical protein